MGKTRPGLRAVTAQRAVIYTRQSQHRDDSVSHELQETSGRDYCARQGYVVVDVIRDEGVSGLKWEKRRGVQRVMAMIEAGEADVIVVWRWSRLSRKRLHQVVAIDAVEKAGARIESALEPFDTTTAGGEFGRDVMLAAAHFESRQKSEDWARNRTRRVEAGLPATGGDRFGYIRAPDKTYSPDPWTGPILADLYRSYIGGHGYPSLAQRLTRLDVPTRFGASMWMAPTVRKILESGFGAGLILNEGTYHPGAHDPVIDGDTWDTYLAVRGRRHRTASRLIEASYVLSGLVRCADCGSGMSATSLGKWPGYAFRCSRYSATGRESVRFVAITRHALEAAVHGWLLRERDRLNKVGEAAAAEAFGERVVSRTDVAAAARAVTRLEERIVKASLDHNAGLIPDLAYKPVMQELTAAHKAAKEALADAEERARVAGIDPGPIIVELLAGWETLSVRARREALALLIECVEVKPTGLVPRMVIVDRDGNRWPCP